MFKIVEMQTAQVISEFSSNQEALDYLANIDSTDGYAELLNRYGSLRRVQQELTIEII